MKTLAFISLFFLTILQVNAQKYISKNGHIWFYSHTAMEDIKADNNEVASILDTGTGDIMFNMLIKSFKFEKALMEEHFNENYMQSATIPKATFKGKITNLSAVNFSKNGVYNVTIEGVMTIHGVAQSVTEKGTLEVKDGKITAKSEFNLKPKDYNIAIPDVVKDNIAESMKVNVEILYSPMN
jgi:hypothetical protein